jgi:hypothetical protein
MMSVATGMLAVIKGPWSASITASTTVELAVLSDRPTYAVSSPA